MHKSEWPANYKDIWPNFTIEEMECKCGCEGVPETSFMTLLQSLRHCFSFPLPVTSGFRCEDYDKYIGGAGVHPTGLAADIAVGYSNAHGVLRWSLQFGFTGIGVKGHGVNRFVHLDTLPLGEEHDHPRPRVWTYNG